MANNLNRAFVEVKGETAVEVTSFFHDLLYTMHPMKEAPTTYCGMMSDPKLPAVHHTYHDEVYGFPVDDDDEIFARLVLELNQAGLSWTTILNKQENFRKAYSNFSVSKVAMYGEIERNRLLSDAGIIRNRLKIDAAIYNAKRIVELQKEHGSFKSWLDGSVGFELDAWVKLFKREFKFTGGEITKEFLLSLGYIEGSHESTCPIYARILALDPPWARVGRA